ncbi:MAG: hypothetical protein IKE70_04375 [Bacilli bacterium]|nr:hypothetical protein [Bacilli bacterium]
MIDKLTYDQVQEISKNLREQSNIISTIAKDKQIQDILDFASTVEGYSKFLENTIEINKDADKALEDLKK